MEGCFWWKEMDFKNTLLTVKTPQSQEQDQHLKESSHPSPDSSDFCRISDQNPSVPVICGVTKGMTSFVPCFNFTC